MTKPNSFFFENEKNIRIVNIPDFLDWACGNRVEYKVSLPMIQRGFVWKPNQIIELWDTLLRGMPIGSLMISEIMGTSESVGLTSLRPKESGGNRLGLIDGQQRTLAMLVGWPLPIDESYSHRLWVDFADDPASGQLLQLRVTTRNQPFGFQRSNPNSKLSLDEKRRAREKFHGIAIDGKVTRKLNQEELKKQQDDYFNHGSPFVSTSHLNFSIDMRDLVGYWRKSNGKGFHSNVMDAIKKIEPLVCVEVEGEKRYEKRNYDNLSEEVQENIEKRIEILSKGLRQLISAEIPLLRVRNDIFEMDNKLEDEPPLAVLFKRIGSNVTPLSNADYIYSILKHLMPELHTMVNTLHSQGHAASLLTETDLVMSAFRLAAANSEGVTDNDNPDKNAFHRLRPKVEEQLNQVLEGFGNYFKIVQTTLLYDQSSNPNGLPVHAFPHFGRPLVQVLLRLAQVGYLTKNCPIDRRDDTLRLTLYWMQWVSSFAPKASLIAFSEIKNWVVADGGSELGKQIYEKITHDKLGLKIFSPTRIKEIEELVISKTPPIDPKKPLRGELRFQLPDASEDVRDGLATYRYWWRPWTYRHPMLIWLQRSYVDAQFWPNPMAKNDEDTPYDYDHILPQSHWHGWTGVKEGTRILEFCAEQGANNLIGNCIGNVRIWDSSENRSDGADSPQTKSNECSEQLLGWSLIDGMSKEDPYWFGSPADAKDRSIWNAERTSAFQAAVERRTFSLYEKLFEEAGFASWAN